MDRIQELVDEGILVESVTTCRGYTYTKYTLSPALKARKKRKKKFVQDEVEEEFQTLLDDDTFKTRTARIHELCSITGGSYPTMMNMVKHML